MYSLFEEAYTNLNESDILDEWYRKPTGGGGILYLPHLLREDIHFLNDIR